MQLAPVFALTLSDIRPNSVPCIALTATATKTIVQDLVKNLKLQNPQSLSMSFDRPNIYYSVSLSRMQALDLFESARFEWCFWCSAMMLC